MKRLLLYYVYLLFVYNYAFSIRSRNSICKNNVCRNRPQVVPYVVQGLVVALRECQHQFRNRRWNCTEKGNSLEKMMRYDYRESAFTLAINAAGVTFAVTRACSLGDLEFCECDTFIYRGQERRANEVTATQVKERFRSRGICESNIDFGEKISKLIFAGSKAKDARTEMIRWNYEAGRKALRKLMEKSCKCFGYSGTCTYTACWLVLPTSFRKVGARLKERFDSASKVSYGNKGNKFHVAEESMKAPTSEDLVYSTNSPTFCEKDSKIGSFGTKGRYCNATSIGVDGCDLMCCNRGYDTKTEEKQTYCKCTFLWCCVVKCKMCNKSSTVNKCL